MSRIVSPPALYADVTDMNFRYPSPEPVSANATLYVPPEKDPDIGVLYPGVNNTLLVARFAAASAMLCAIVRPKYVAYVSIESRLERLTLVNARPMIRLSPMT